MQFDVVFSACPAYIFKRLWLVHYIFRDSDFPPVLHAFFKVLVVSPSCFKTLFHIPLTYPMCIGFWEVWGHWHSRMPKKVKYGRLNLGGWGWCCRYGCHHSSNSIEIVVDNEIFLRMNARFPPTTQAQAGIPLRSHRSTSRNCNNILIAVDNEISTLNKCPPPHLWDSPLFHTNSQQTAGLYTQAQAGTFYYAASLYSQLRALD